MIKKLNLIGLFTLIGFFLNFESAICQNSEWPGLDFQPTTIRAFLNAQDDPKVYANKIYYKGFSATVMYTGKSRVFNNNTPFVDYVFKDSNFMSLYEREIEIKEGPHTLWLPIQKSIFPFLKDELAPGDLFQIAVRYYGLDPKTQEPLMLIIGFLGEPAEKTRNKKSPLTNSLSDIQLDASFEKVKNQLCAKKNKKSNIDISYKTSMATNHVRQLITQTDSCVQYHQYRSRVVAAVLDDKYSTAIAAHDASPLEPDKIYSIQISGSPNPDLVLPKNIRLGMSSKEITSLLGKPDKICNIDEYEYWDYNNILFFIAFKNDKLALVKISNDLENYE